MKFKSWKHCLLSLLLILKLQPLLADIGISVTPATLNLVQGQSQLVAINLTNIPANGLAAFQFTLNYDPALMSLDDPNAGPNSSLVQPFAPLGGNTTVCEIVRGGTCTDPVWLLTATGRTVLANIRVNSTGGKAQIAYVTGGTNPAPSTDGVIALIKVTGVATGNANLSIDNMVFGTADAQALASLPSPPVSVIVVDPNTNAPPTIEPIANQTNNETDSVSLPAHGSDINGDTLTFAASGLPSGITIDPVNGLISGVLNYMSAGTYPVKVTVTENTAEALSATTSFQWTVNDVNRAPTISPIPAQNNLENSVVSITVVAADPDGNILQYSATGLPSGVSINTSTGLISGTLDFNSANTYNVSVKVSDIGIPSLSATTDFVWKVDNVNRPPAIANPGDQNKRIGDNISLQIVAADPDQNLISYTAQNLPPGVSINGGNGLITGIIADTALPSYTSTVVATDNDMTSPASAQTTFKWNISAAPAMITIVQPLDQNSAENSTVNLAISATASDNSAIVYSVTGLPPGLSISLGGVISGYLDYNAAGEYTPMVKASLQSDPSINKSANFLWHVSNTNREPVANAGMDLNVQTGALTTLDGSASNDPDGQTLTFTWHVLSVPVNSTVTDQSLANINAPQTTFTPDLDGNYEIQLVVSDGELATVDSVNVMATTPPNVSPNANAGPDQQVQTQSAVVLNASASNDPDNAPQPLSYHWYFVTLPNGSGLNDSSISNANSIQASFNPDVAGVYVIGLDVSDGDLVVTDQIQVTAIYTNVPPVANAGADQTINIGSVVSLDGSASNDPDFYPQALSYQWSIVSIPSGSAITNASISNQNLVSASLIPDLVGTYLVRLDISDGEASSFDQMTITVQSVGQVPSAPSRLRASVRRTRVSLSWRTAANSNAYNIYRKLDSETVFAAIGQSTSTSFTDTVPTGTNTASYYVVGTNQYGEGPASNTVNVTIK